MDGKEGSIARSAITRVTCDTQRVVVGFSVRGHDDLIRVNTDWDIDTLEVSPDVEIRWSGTSEHGIEFAQEFCWALGEALQVARHITYVLRERRFDSIGGSFETMVPQPDYTLLAYLLVHGEKVAYVRGRELTGEESDRVYDLDGLREATRAQVLMAADRERSA
jgi:hypothetical protein